MDKYLFPASWTDEQIHLALSFANKTYELGIEIGKAARHSDQDKG